MFTEDLKKCPYWHSDDDPLFWILENVLHIMKYKAFQIYAMYCIAVHTLSILVQTYYILNTFDSIYLIQYGPTYFGILYGLNSVAMFFWKRNATKQIFHYAWKNSIKIETVNSENQDTISKQIKPIKHFMIINTVLAVVACSAMIWDVKDEAKLYFAVEEFRKFYPEYIGWFIFSYYITYPFLTYAMIAPIYLFIYFMQLACFQAMCYKQIAEDFLISYRDIDVMEAYNDESYQRNVSAVLRMLAYRHSLLLSGIKLGCNYFFITFLTFTLTGTLLGISIVYYARVLIYLPVRGMIRFGSMGAVASLNIYMFCHTAQRLTDMCESVFLKFCKLPWYQWSIPNQKMYLFILMRCVEHLAVSISSFFLIDNTLMVKLFKTIYSMGTLISAHSMNQVATQVNE